MIEEFLYDNDSLLEKDVSSLRSKLIDFFSTTKGEIYSGPENLNYNEVCFNVMVLIR